MSGLLQEEYDDAGLEKPFDVRLGHVMDVIQCIPDESVDCCVTSPPYWGLRDYGTPDQVWGGDSDHDHAWSDIIPGSNRGGSGTPNGRNGGGETYGRDSERGSFCDCGAWRGSLGLEPTPALFVEHIAMVFREVRRVLKRQGTAWLNLGDSFCSTDKWGGGKNGNTGKHRISDDGTVPSWAVRARRDPIPGLKPKDLIGIPWRCAFALQDDGWWLRSDIVWAKGSPMPESVRDRPTRSHEYIFLLAKSQKYYYDAAAIAEPCKYPLDDRKSRANLANKEFQSPFSARMNPHADGLTGTNKPLQPSSYNGSSFSRGKTKEAVEQTGAKVGETPRNESTTRNKRDVWTINTQPTPEAHFACMPIALAETCILAGSPAGGVVLDPFSGAGTTGLAAIKHGRNYIGIELNPEYAKITSERTDRHAPLFA